ncbi:MAG: PAS domain S-box protein [Gemmatimonadaceae bacterium]
MLIASGFALSLAVLNASYHRAYLREWARMWAALAVYAFAAGTALLVVNVAALQGIPGLRPGLSLAAIAAAYLHLRYLGAGMQRLCVPDTPPPAWRDRTILVLSLVAAALILVPVVTDPTASMTRYVVRITLLALAWGLAYGAAGLLILREVTATSALGRWTLGWALLFYAAVRTLEPLAHLLGPSPILAQFLTFGGLPLIVAMGAGMLISLLEVERARAVEEATARATAERATHKSEALLATALASTSDAVFVVGLDDRLIAFNARFASLVTQAYGLAVAPGMTMSSILEGRHLELWTDAFRRGAAGESHLRHEEVPLRPGEEMRRFAVRVVPVALEAGLLGVLVVVHDATDEDRVREAVAKREEWFGSMIENSSDIIFMVSPDGTIAYASPSLRRVLGHAPEALIGLSGFAFVHPDDVASLRDAMERSFAKDESAPFVVPFRAKGADGEYVALEAVSRPFVEADGTPRLIVSARDVRERQRLEAELLSARRLETVGRLAGGVAHDFNNLLTAIIGNLALMRDGVDDRRGLEGHISEIEHAVQRGAELTRRLLAFARRQMIEPRVLDLALHLRDLERLLTRLVGDRLALEIDAPPPVWPVRMDPTALEQVLVNLAVNARDAMPPGGTLTIRAQNLTVLPTGDEPLGIPAGDWVRVDVTDTGTGIDESLIGQIFEPFFTTKGETGGTGLGLATVYGTVRQAGGHVRVRSQLGAGTTFSLLIPRAAAPSPAPVAKDGAARLPRANGDETILVIEDETSVRGVTVKLLTRLGYTVLSAVNGLDGVTRAAEFDGRLDLVLSDLVMPGLGGVDAVARIRETRPDVAVIFISGFSAEALQWRGGMPSGGRLLSKPFLLEDLASTVRQTLDERRLARGGEDLGEL